MSVGRSWGGAGPWLSVGRLAVPAETTPSDRVAEGIVPRGTIGAVQDRVPAPTFDVRNTFHRGLAAWTLAGWLGCLRRRLRRLGLR